MAARATLVSAALALRPDAPRSRACCRWTTCCDNGSAWRKCRKRPVIGRRLGTTDVRPGALNSPYWARLSTLSDTRTLAAQRGSSRSGGPGWSSPLLLALWQQAMEFNCYAASYRHDIAVVETGAAQHPLARPASDRCFENGAGVNERVILAVFTAGVGSVREVTQKIFINFPTGK